jgi:hypothetical protein
MRKRFTFLTGNEIYGNYLFLFNEFVSLVHWIFQINFGWLLFFSMVHILDSHFFHLINKHDKNRTGIFHQLYFVFHNIFAMEFFIQNPANCLNLTGFYYQIYFYKKILLKFFFQFIYIDFSLFFFVSELLEMAFRNDRLYRIFQKKIVL